MRPLRTLSHEEARHFYDRFGARQDSQLWYEREAIARLCAHLDLDPAQSVVELGCGTGRFAAELLDGLLPPDARYLGLDVSATMVELARQRTARFGERVEIRQTDGAPRIDAPDGAFDRFVSTYVLDLLSEADVRAVLAEAHRVLAPGGRLGLASLTRGESLLSRGLTRAWEAVHRLNPLWVGGCRPLALAGFVADGGWTVLHHECVEQVGIASEVLVARR
ncbi:MAG TPA: class I SAM-dependent methyltransferase [Myxococcota bacterium]|nr:class I SAM-dependent methyltransferase [Myxococcota bacterium]